MKQLFLALIVSCCWTQTTLACDEYNNFSSSYTCQKYYQQCTYDSWSSCYVPTQTTARCDDRRGEYDTQSTCEYYVQSRRCVYQNGCYVEDRFTSRCDANFQEYDTESRCERMTNLNCRYESSSGCYVPQQPRPTPPPTPAPTPVPTPQPPRCPSEMPASVCTSGSIEENGTGWGSNWDCERHMIERYGSNSGKSCYQKSNCCYGIN